MFKTIPGMFFSKFITEITSNFNWLSVIELLLVGGFIFVVYKKFIKNSPSRKLFNGILSIIIFYVFSKILIAFKLFILGRFLEGISTILLFSLVVIFQPELRRFLGYIGQPEFIRKTFFSQEDTSHDVDFIKELTDAIKFLSKSKIGALIVVQNMDGITDYSEVGTKLNSVLSSELLLTIFHPNTALHDGAVVIQLDKILSAGVLLPLTDNVELSWQYGTRHRAAIGITEVTDATCIVVSEETGNVSIAEAGQLKKIENMTQFTEELERIIEERINPKKKEIKTLKQENEETSDNN